MLASFSKWRHSKSVRYLGELYQEKEINATEFCSIAHREVRLKIRLCIKDHTWRSSTMKMETT